MRHIRMAAIKFHKFRINCKNAHQIISLNRKIKKAEKRNGDPSHANYDAIQRMHENAAENLINFDGKQKYYENRVQPKHYESN